MGRRPLATMSVAYALVVASIVGVPLAFGPGTAVAANHLASGPTFAVGQGGECIAEIRPLGSGSTDGPTHYDYRTGEFEFSSYGTTDLQASEVSQFYVYDGSDGLSLVFLHDELGDEALGGAVTFEVTGLPADGTWTVEDDDYNGQDDVFNHSGTSSDLNWMWGKNRTDGAVFLGLGSDDWSEITVDPAFQEESYGFEQDWPDATEGPNEWWVRSAGNETTTIGHIDESDGMDEPVSIRREGCDAVSPSAALADPGDVTVGTNVTLDASNPSSPTTPIRYEWAFGDGSSATTTTPTVQHRYDDVGNVTGAVTVTDRFGNEDAASTTFSVGNDTAENSPPSVNLTADPATVTAGGNVTLDANASDPDGDPLNHSWSQVAGPTLEALPTGDGGDVTPTDAGTYEVAVTVTDPAGASATDAATFVVEETDGTNQAPAAAFDWTPETPTAGRNVSFDASNSTDPDGSIARYEWDFDGDGTFEANATTPLADHAFPEPGTYDVTLRVTDDGGAEKETTRAVEVVTADGSPSVTLAADPETATVGDPVNLSTTTTLDGGSLNYTWTQLSGPAVLALPNGSSGTVSPPEAGAYEVSVTVENSSGDSATDTATFEAVAPDEPPTADFDWSPANPTVDETVTFDAGNATDPEGSPLTYEWTFDDGSNATGETTTHAFASAGDHDVTLNVTDGAGSVATETRTLAVAADGSTGSGGGSGSPGSSGSGSSGGSSGGSGGSSSAGGSTSSGGAPGGGGASGDRSEPSYVVTAVSANRTTASVGDAVAVTATVENRGEAAGPRPIGFAVDHRTLVSRDVDVQPGRSTNLTFTTRLDEPGTRTLRVGENETTVTVRTPAPATAVASMRLEVATIDAGETTTVVATVTNSGEAPGRHEVTLNVFDEVVDRAVVSVEPGETRTVRFSQRFDAPGDYTVAVGDRESTVHVVGESTEADGTYTVSVHDGSDRTTALGFVAAGGLALAGAAVLLSRRL